MGVATTVFMDFIISFIYQQNEMASAKHWLLPATIIIQLVTWCVDKTLNKDHVRKILDSITRIHHCQCTHHSRGVHPFSNQSEQSNNNQHRHGFISRIQFITLPHSVNSFRPIDMHTKYTPNQMSQAKFNYAYNNHAYLIAFIYRKYVDLRAVDFRMIITADYCEHVSERESSVVNLLIMTWKYQLSVSKVKVVYSFFGCCLAHSPPDSKY